MTSAPSLESTAREIVAKEPHNANALGVLGNLMVARESQAATAASTDFTAGIIHMRNAIMLGCTIPEVFSAFANAVARLKKVPAKWDVAEAMRRTLTSEYILPVFLLQPVLAVLRGNTDFAEAHRLAGVGDTMQLKTMLAAGHLRGSIGSPLFLAMLRAAVVSTPALEIMLTAARRHFLHAAQDPAHIPHPADHALCCALAEQCYLNEYAYWVTPEETDKIAALAESYGALAADNRTPDPFAAAVLACYGPLSAYAFADVLVARYPAHDASDFSRVVARQIHDPAIEQHLAITLDSGAIADATSQAVRRMYEENPYPRWTMRFRASPAPFRDAVRAKFPATDMTAMESVARPQILIAGCGTGSHIQVATSGYESCDVTALDLSRGSLAYAMREMKKQGVDNVTFVHGDILNVSSLRRQFDMIECIGVLHHMADPMAGWRALLGQLKAGGLMHIGLYSAAARRGVNMAREIAAKRGYAPSTEGIRRFRRDLIAATMQPAAARSTDDQILIESKIERAQDFYSISMCRDLVFHIQERQYTIPEIAAMLAALNLRFVGFSPPSTSFFDGYIGRFPDDPACLDLANWDIFEQENPHTFTSMYNFMVQKP
jgi:2-polyprenyl-3-methyl-5-hydroxy-6-metoxy-1,4-benzoquinol methylase